MERFLAGFFISAICTAAAIAVLNGAGVSTTDATGWLFVIGIGMGLRFMVEKLVIYRLETED